MRSSISRRANGLKRGRGDSVTIPDFIGEISGIFSQIKEFFPGETDFTQGGLNSADLPGSMINVLDRARRFSFRSGAAVCLIRVAALFSISTIQSSANRNPVSDYLPRVGPAPLRFEAQRADLMKFALPPLDMGTKTNDTNPPPLFPETIDPLPDLTQWPLPTQATNSVPNGPVPRVEVTETNAPPAQTLDAATQLLSSPLPPNESVLAPQMFVHFFQKTGTNQAASVFLSTEAAIRSEPSGKSSSAIYVSP